MPSSENIVRTLAFIRKNAVNHADFFSGVESPDWIDPLIEAGFFKHPPDADATGFPAWPESEYLARMAPVAPRRVARVVQNVPLTENLAVHADLARAAIHLSADSAAQWASREAAWLSGPSLDEGSGVVPGELAEALGSLVDRLVDAGEVRAAMSLASSLLEIRFVADHAGAGHVSEPAPAPAYAAAVPSTRCKIRLHERDYRDFVDRRLPVLLKSGGVDVLAMLCNLIERSTASVEPAVRDALLSRPAIERHGQNRGNEPSDVLVDAVRDAARILVESGVPVRSVVAAMDRPRPAVFKRIILHLAAEWRIANPELAAELVLCRSNLGDDHLAREYGALLGAVFPTLEDAQKSRLLEWIDEGPSLRGPMFADRGDRRMQTLRWQAERLARIREHLNGEWRRWYEAMAEKVGQPADTQSSAGTAAWMGPSAPVTASDLRRLSAAEVAEYLGRWEPSGDPTQATREDVASVLEEVVADSPARFVAEADAFAELAVPYVEGLVRGLHQAWDDGHYLDWTLVVALFQKITVPRPGDLAWGAVRSECLILLWAGFRDGSVDIGLREPVWTVINAVCDDADPTPADDAEPTTDFGRRSFNRVRAQALHLVVQYARWVHSHETWRPRGDRSVFGLRDIPEVRQRLERHLDPEVEPSPSVRAVYGQWFPHLCLLDEAWARDNASAIFSERFPHLRDAAWETYVKDCPAYTKPFALLRGQYLDAVHRLAEPVEPVAPERRPVTSRDTYGMRLGLHLLLAAGYGALSRPCEDADDDGDLLTAYFLNADPSDARKAVLAIGRILRDEGRELRPETVSRFGQLVDALLDMRVADRELLTPMRSLASWIASGRFEPAWSLRRLRRVIERAGLAERTFAAMDYLAETAADQPAESFRVLESWVEAGGLERDLAAGRYANMHQVLRAALAEDSVNDEARALIKRLGEAGHGQFWDLLEPRRSRGA